MLAGMGYKGGGLGRNQHGLALPLEAAQLKKGAGLGVDASGHATREGKRAPQQQSALAVCSSVGRRVSAEPWPASRQLVKGGDVRVLDIGRQWPPEGLIQFQGEHVCCC